MTDRDFAFLAALRTAMTDSGHADSYELVETTLVQLQPYFGTEGVVGTLVNVVSLASLLSRTTTRDGERFDLIGLLERIDMKFGEPKPVDRQRH